MRHNTIRSGFGRAAAFAAALAVALPMPALAQQNPVQAGVSAAVKGAVQLARAFDGTIGRRLESGEPIYLRDVISAGPDAAMQIMLMDETVFTIGANSEIVIDEFVYDPDTNVGRITAQIVKGAFRFTTGLIGQEDPDSVSIGTPLGTIGIRGTIVAGAVGETEALIVLVGPGDEAGTKERVGRIQVSNGEGSVDISRSGYGTTLSEGAPPTPPAVIPQTQIDSILTSVQGDSADDPNNADTNTETEADAASSTGEDDGDGGQAAADGGDASSEAEGAQTEANNGGDSGPTGASGAPLTTLTASIGGTSIESLSGSVIEEGEQASLEVKETVENEEGSDDTVEEADTVASTLGEITTLANLASVTTGSGTITGNGALSGTLGSTGTFSFTGVVNFGDQTAQFSMNANWSGTNSGSFTINAGPETYTQIFSEGGATASSNSTFDSISGTDLKGFDSTDGGDDNFSGLNGNETAKVDLRLRNTESVVAAFMDVDVVITDNSGAETISGSATGGR